MPIVMAAESAWEVYSLGDISYLLTVYRGLAMVFGSGSLLMLGMIGFMVAVIMVGLTSVIKGGRELPAQNILLCFVAWWVFFGLPPQNVILIDKYTGRSDVVTNVPFGVAASQSIITGMGMAATRMMEQAFANPGMTDTEFGSALHAIVELRQLSGFVGHPEIGRIQENASNYFGYCAPWLGNLGDADALRRAFRAESALDASVSVNPNIHIPYRKRDDTGTILADSLNCADVYRGIKTDLESDLFTQSVVEIGALGGREDVVNDLDAAYSTLSQQNLAAVEQMRNMVMAGPINKGLAIYARRTTDPSVAAMMEPAVWQRNVQWAAEGDLFMTFVRPLITFIEGFIVAVTPMMALMIAASLSGIMLVFSYLKMTIWVQLWFPLLAVINLFLTMAMARDLDSVAGVETIKPASIEASWGLIQTASTHIATAGMLAAAVPALAYALISMSPMAFTHLMGRLQGSDTVNEKILAPDVMTPSTGVKVDPVKTSSEFGGTTFSGAGAEGGSYKFDYTDTSRLTEAQTQGYKATENYLSTMGNITSRNATLNSQWMRAVDTSFSSSTMQNRMESVGQDETDSFKKGLQATVGQNFTNNNTQTGGFNVAASPTAMIRGFTKAAAGLAELDEIGDVEAPKHQGAVRRATSNVLDGLREMFPDTKFTYQDVNNYIKAQQAGETSSLSKDFSNLIREHRGIGLVMNEGLGIAARDVESHSGSVGLSEQDQRSLNASTSELLESGQTWSRTADSSGSAQVSTTGQFTTLARTAANQGEDYVGALADRATNLGLGSTMHEATRFAQSRLGMEGNQATAYGALVALAGGNNVGIAPTNANGASVQEGRAVFGDVVRELTGHEMNFSPVSSTPPPSLGTAIPRGGVQGAVTSGLRPGAIPASGSVDAGVTGVAATTGDAGHLEAIVSARADEHQPYIDSTRSNMRADHDTYTGVQHVRQNQTVLSAYDDVAKMASESPAPSGMESLGDNFNVFRNVGVGAGVYVKPQPFRESGAIVEQHVSAISAQAEGFEYLAQGMAVGEYIHSRHSEEFPSQNEQLNAAREYFGMEEGSVQWGQMKPMVIMGLNGHINPRSNAVQNVAGAIQAVDRQHSRSQD